MKRKSISTSSDLYENGNASHNKESSQPEERRKRGRNQVTRPPFLPLAEEFKGKNYGPEAATKVNTCWIMKSCPKNCYCSGRSGPINNLQVQKRVICISKNRHELPRGVLITDVLREISATNTTRKANSASCTYQDLLRQNVQIEQRVQDDYRIRLVLSKYVQDLYAKLNMPVTGEIAVILQAENTCARSFEQGTTESSHAANDASGSHNSDGIEDDEGDTNLE